MQIVSLNSVAMVITLSSMIFVSWLALVNGHLEKFDKIFLIILLSSNISPFLSVSGELTFKTIHTIEILGVSMLYFYLLISSLIALCTHKKRWQLYTGVLVCVVIGLLGGLFNTYADENYFIREFMILTAYLLAFLIWYPKKNTRSRAIRDFLPVMILGRLISAVVMAGTFDHYSISLGIILFHNPAVPPMLLLAFALSNKFGKLNIIALALGAVILLLNFQKGFLVQYIFVILCFFVFTANKTTRIVPLLIISSAILVAVSSQFRTLPTIDRINYEVRSFQSVSDGLSPRAVEMKNILVRADENMFKALFGGGLGSFFNEKPYKFRSWQLNESAFTQGELKSGKFYKPHTTFSWLILKFGFLGLTIVMFFYATAIYRMFVKRQLEVVSASVLAYTFWILMQNTTVAIFSVIIFSAFVTASKHENTP